jgi:ASPIC and UnbV/FG-GAP-like repeat
VATLQDSGLLSDTQNVAAIALYGRVLAEAQMFDRLQSWAASAPTSCERYPDFWIACGLLASRTDKQASIDCFAKAISLDPSEIEAYYGIVESLEAIGETEQAEKFRFRSGALDSILRDVRKIRESAELPPQLTIDVATQLMGIGRPLESVAWQEYLLSQYKPNSPQFKSMPEFKARVLKEFPTGRDEAEILCGWKTSDFQTADSWLANLRKGETKPAQTLPESYLPSTKVQRSTDKPVFVNVAKERQIDFRYLNAAEPVEKEFQIFQAFGGGAACLDFDLDGSIDFYFGQAATTPPDGVSDLSNGLFRHVGKRFVDVIQPSGADDRGYTVGVTAGDWNQDGFADLVIGNLGINRLLINQGDGTFREMRDQQLSEEAAYTSSLAIADITSDGLPEIIEINYLDDPEIFEPIQRDADGKPLSLPGPLQFQAAKDRLLVSTGDGSMSSQPLGGQSKEIYSTGLALLVTDLDGKRGNEIFVANDLRANHYWIHENSDDPSSPLMDAAVPLSVAYGNKGKPMACMGIAAADFDHNGLLDLHVSNFENEWSNQYMQMNSGAFQDSAVAFNLDTLTHKMLGFGTQAIDYDNNTFWDLIVGNGHIEDATHKGRLFAMPTQLLVLGPEGFSQPKVFGDDAYWNGLHFSRAMAKCDFDRDGKVDLVISDLKSGVALLNNQTQTENHWFQIECVGVGSERDAIGTRLSVRCDSETLVQAVQTGDGYISKNESAVFFGIGKAEEIGPVHVRWPSGAEQTFNDLEVNKRWLLIEGQSEAWLQW